MGGALYKGPADSGRGILPGMGPHLSPGQNGLRLHGGSCDWAGPSATAHGCCLPPWDSHGEQEAPNMPIMPVPGEVDRCSLDSVIRHVY